MSGESAGTGMPTVTQARALATRHAVPALMLPIYDDEAGVYLSRRAAARRLRSLILATGAAMRVPLGSRDVHETVSALSDLAEPVELADRARFIPLANGDYDVETATLLPCSPDRPFLHRAAAAYAPMMPMPGVTMPDGSDWTPGGWLASTFGPSPDNPADYRPLIRQMIAAALCPAIATRIAQAIFLNGTGRNGKSSLVNLLRSIVGESMAVDSNLSDFCGSRARWLGARLVGRSLLYGDDNEPNTYLTHTALFKSVVSGGSITAEAKGRMGVSYAPQVLVVQNFNGYPQSADKSDAFRDRICPVTLTHVFQRNALGAAVGAALHRPDVLDWMASWALAGGTDFDHWDVPQASRDALVQMQVDNDWRRRFWADIEPELGRYRFVSSDALYALACDWARTTGNPAPANSARFMRDLRTLGIVDPARWRSARQRVRFYSAVPSGWSDAQRADAGVLAQSISETSQMGHTYILDRDETARPADQRSDANMRRVMATKSPQSPAWCARVLRNLPLAFASVGRLPGTEVTYTTADRRPPQLTGFLRIDDVGQADGEMGQAVGHVDSALPDPAAALLLTGIDEAGSGGSGSPATPAHRYTDPTIDDLLG